MKSSIFTAILISLFVMTACGNQVASVSGADQLPGLEEIELFYVGGTDKAGISTEETNAIIEEEHKVTQALDILNEISFESIDREYVTSEALHFEANYTLLFIEDLDAEEQFSIWLLDDGSIIIPTWEGDYYIKEGAEQVHDELLDVLEVGF
ncbi:hypothetical protein [Alteribacter aurantiacus]|uniref:hypothetical protein n=1 Tax=Alteribacter aurantiacus TaxID=254410 RepID=UPI00040522A7|nr:hypothetical protein [Alteribacter aurantiacus]